MGVDDSQTIGEKFGLFITERLTGEKDCFNPHHQGTYVLYNTQLRVD